MARSNFGQTTHDFLVTTHPFWRGTSGSLTFWSAESGGTQYTDLLLDGDATTIIPVGPTGMIPLFQGPDGVTSMWADEGVVGGNRLLLTDIVGLTAASSASATAAAASAAAAAAVGSTNDTIIAAQLNNAASASRTAYDTSAGRVDVRSKGATTGAADNATAFHAARDAAAAFGAEVFVPDGTWLVGALTLNAANQTFRLGPRATVKLKNSANANLVTITAAGVTIQGGTLDANRANQTANGYGVVATTINGISLKGVAFLNTRSEAVFLSGCSDVLIDGCSTTNCAPSGNRKAIALVDTGGSYGRVRIINNNVDGTTSANGGIVVQSNTSSNVARDITISGNTIRVGDDAASRLAIELYAATGGTIAGAVIADNNISAPGTGTGTFGISLGGVATTSTTGVNGATISGNMIRNCKGPGIEVIGRNVSVTGNTLEVCGHLSVASNDVSGGMTGVAVVGNTIRDNTNINYTIQLNSSATNPQYGTIVANNILENSAGVGIDLVGKFYDGSVDNNTVRSPNNSGIIVNASCEITGSSITRNRLNLTGAAANTDGILIASTAAADATIEGNIITGATRHGINFSVAVNRILVRGNTASACTTNGINTTGGDRFVFLDNYCHHNSNRGISLSGSPTLTTWANNVAHDNTVGQLVSGGTFSTTATGGFV